MQRSMRYTSASDHPRDASSSPVVAVIIDMEKSRALEEQHRREVQGHWRELLNEWNGQFRHQILSRFLLTLGDECQGVLYDPRVLPDLLWALEGTFPTLQFRWGIGFGRLWTELNEEALGMDGPAFHAARYALEHAKRARLRGGVFHGFPGELNAILNGYARVLHHQRAHWTTKQREIVEAFRNGRRSVDIARDRGVTPQLVAQQLTSTGAKAYLEGELGMRAVLASVGLHTEWT